MRLHQLLGLWLVSAALKATKATTSLVCALLLFRLVQPWIYSDVGALTSLARKLPAHTARTRKIPQNWPRRCFSAKQKRKNWAFCKTAKFSLSLSLCGSESCKRSHVIASCASKPDRCMQCWRRMIEKNAIKRTVTKTFGRHKNPIAMATFVNWTSEAEEYPATKVTCIAHLLQFMACCAITSAGRKDSGDAWCCAEAHLVDLGCRVIAGNQV